MDPFKVMALWVAVTDRPWVAGADGNERRVLTAAELDALAEPLWNWHDQVESVKGFVRALGPRWRPRTVGPMEEVALIAAETR